MIYIWEKEHHVPLSEYNIYITTKKQIIKEPYEKYGTIYGKK
jgi:hypothetical protein